MLNSVLFVDFSRDTTVKVWQLCTGEELHNLGSHTMTVTAVVLIIKQHAAGLWEEFALEDKDKVCKVAINHLLAAAVSVKCLFYKGLNNAIWKHL